MTGSRSSHGRSNADTLSSLSASSPRASYNFPTAKHCFGVEELSQGRAVAGFCIRVNRGVEAGPRGLRLVDLGESTQSDTFQLDNLTAAWIRPPDNTHHWV